MAVRDLQMLGFAGLNEIDNPPKGDLTRNFVVAMPPLRIIARFGIQARGHSGGVVQPPIELGDRQKTRVAGQLPFAPPDNDRQIGEKIKTQSAWHPATTYAASVFGFNCSL